MIYPLWHTQIGHNPSYQNIILLHGACSNAKDWPDSFADKLYEHKTNVYAVDLKDSGKNRWNYEEPYYIEDMADDVINFMTAQRINKAHIIGASMGGAIAQHMAIKSPKTVSSLCLLMSTSTRGIWDPSIKSCSKRVASAIEYEYKLHKSNLPYEALRHRYEYLSYPNELNEKETEKRIKKVLKHGLNPICQHVSAFQFSRSRTYLFSKIQCPCLIIHGKKDELLPVEHAFLMHENIPHSKLHLIDDMGHHISNEFVDPIIDSICTHLLV